VLYSSKAVEIALAKVRRQFRNPEEGECLLSEEWRPLSRSGNETVTADTCACVCNM
jgi:hypothetical protein